MAALHPCNRPLSSRGRWWLHRSGVCGRTGWVGRSALSLLLQRPPVTSCKAPTGPFGAAQGSPKVKVKGMSAAASHWHHHSGS